jgi:hypothetical protein
LTTEIARSASPFAASTIPTTFSTAFPAMATMTRPAKAWEMPSDSMAGSSALTNQSEAKAAPAPDTASSATERVSGATAPWPAVSCASSRGSSERR